MWDKPCYKAFGELKTKLVLPYVLKFAEFDKAFEVYTETNDFSIVECWCKMDNHGIWEQ
jgi:hypothetical protein